MSSLTGRGYPFPQLGDTVDVPGDIEDLAEAIDADVQTVADGLTAWGTRLTQGTPQTGLTSGSYFTLLFGTEDFDLTGLHDTGSNTSRIVIGQKLGLWLAGGTFAAASNANMTNARARITVNGSAVNGALGSDPSPAGSGGPLGMFQAFLPVVATLATDYVELQGLVTSGSGTIGSQVNGEARSSFWAVYLGS